MEINIPIFLTLIRVITIPFFVFIFYLPYKCMSLICVIIFILSAITDFFDGFLARRWQQITKFGEFLDPVADKIAITTILILIEEILHSWWITLPILVIIIREIIVSALREWMAEIGMRDIISVLRISKIKTLVQMLSTMMLLLHSHFIFMMIGSFFLYTASVLTCFSMFQYFNIIYYKFSKNQKLIKYNLSK